MQDFHRVHNCPPSAAERKEHKDEDTQISAL